VKTTAPVDSDEIGEDSDEDSDEDSEADNNSASKRTAGEQQQR
jgi:hypothetical protein